jgi:hypothetical protein
MPNEPTGSGEFANQMTIARAVRALTTNIIVIETFGGNYPPDPYILNNVSALKALGNVVIDVHYYSGMVGNSTSVTPILTEVSPYTNAGFPVILGEIGNSLKAIGDSPGGIVPSFTAIQQGAIAGALYWPYEEYGGRGNNGVIRGADGNLSNPYGLEVAKGIADLQLQKAP